MLRIKVSDLNFQNKSDNHLELERFPSDWAIEKIDAPFDCYTVHINSRGKLNKVVSVDDIATMFIEGGGSVVRKKLTIPGIASLISCRDASGHVFSFIEEHQ